MTEVLNASEVMIENTEATAEVEVEAQAETKEATVGEIMEQEAVKAETVPLATFLELKNNNKDLARQMKDLQKQIESGASKKEVSSDLKAIAEKHNIDEDFLQDLANTIRSSAKAEVEEELESKLKPLQDKEKAEKLDKAFDSQWDKLMEAMPEYKDIANKSIIKSLAFNRDNANKTFAKILEEAYGKLVAGKQTMETSKPGSGKSDDSEIDFAKVNNPEYFKQIMDNPNLKAKYNKDLVTRLGL